MALYREVRCMLLVREGSIRLMGESTSASTISSASTSAAGSATAAAANPGSSNPLGTLRPHGVTGGAGRAPRGATAAGARNAGRRRSSASIVECMRAAASALAVPPDAGGAYLGGCFGAGGRWVNTLAAAEAASQQLLPLASLGLKESFVSLLVKEPAISLASDPALHALLPGFQEVRVTLLAGIEQP